MDYVWEAVGSDINAQLCCFLVGEILYVFFSSSSDMKYNVMMFMGFKFL